MTHLQLHLSFPKQDEGKFPLEQGKVGYKIFPGKEGLLLWDNNNNRCVERRVRGWSPSDTGECSLLTMKSSTTGGCQRVQRRYAGPTLWESNLVKVSLCLLTTERGVAEVGDREERKETWYLVVMEGLSVSATHYLWQEATKLQSDDCLLGSLYTFRKVCMEV